MVGLARNGLDRCNANARCNSTFSRRAVQGFAFWGLMPQSIGMNQKNTEAKA
jgi:hypothetical protein